MNDKPRNRLLLVLDGVYPIDAGGGGAEQQVRTLAAKFKQRGLQVEILVPMVPFGAQQKHDVIDGTRVYRIPYPNLPLLGSVFLLGQLAWYLFRNRESYDIIHAHIAHRMAAVSCLVGGQLGKPVVVKLTGWLEIANGILSPDYVSSFEGKWMRRQFRKAHYYQAISQEIASSLLKAEYSKDKISLIPNAVDTDKFCPASVEEKQALRVRYDIGQATVGIYVGRMIPEKSLDVLLQAWKKALGDSDACLVMVGDGPQTTELQDLVNGLGIEESVRFMGSRKDVPQLLGIADFGLLTSKYEGLSNTLLEYMATGLPVIGTRISGTSDLITDRENGALFQPGDVNELCECLCWLTELSEADRRILGNCARSTVSAYAGVDSVTARLLNMYESLLPTSASSRSDGYEGQP